MAGVLIVDDEPEIVQFIGHALEDEGFAVSTAADGEEAVELATRDKPDLVVLDIALPRLDGKGVAAEIRRLYGAVPILVITADGHAREKAELVGAYGYLRKPFDLDQLVSSIQERLRS
ncbi:MAG TPA: response regulator [Chloroflexota bacterium]|nr:response regulator [Chloroflexota bacterium]